MAATLVEEQKLAEADLSTLRKGERPAGQIVADDLRRREDPFVDYDHVGTPLEGAVELSEREVVGPLGRRDDYREPTLDDNKIAGLPRSKP